MTGAHPRTSLTEQIAEKLRTAVVRGDYKSGDRLPSTAVLTDAYGVSRTVVREAIAALRSEGILESRKGAGVYVQDQTLVPVTLSKLSTLPEVIDMLELRAAVEVEAAGLAAERGSPAQHAAIGECLRGVELWVPGSGNSAALDLAFHESIAAATNNPRFTAFLSSLGLHAVPRSRLLDAQDEEEAMQDYLTQLNFEHRTIFDAISARDADGSRAAMRTHLAGGLARYQALQDRVKSKFI